MFLGIDISQFFLNIYVFGIIINLREFSIVQWTVQHNPSITVDFIIILRAVGSKPNVTLKIIGMLDLKKIFFYFGIVATQNKTSTKLKLSVVGNNMTTVLCRFKKFCELLLLIRFSKKICTSPPKLALRTLTSHFA